MYLESCSEGWVVLLTTTHAKNNYSSRCLHVHLSLHPLCNCSYTLYCLISINPISVMRAVHLSVPYTAIRLPCCGPVTSRKFICNPDVTAYVGFRLTYPRSDRLLTKRIAGREIHPRKYVNNTESLRYFIVKFHSSPQRLPYNVINLQ